MRRLSCIIPRKLQFWFSLMTAVIFCMAGCAPKHASDFVGTYRLDNRIDWGTKMLSHGIEVLKLRKDGTYTQTVTLPNGSFMKSEGRWKYDENTVWLTDALWVPLPNEDIKTHPITREDVGLGVERSCSEDNITDFCLVKNPDLPLYYRKIR